MSQSESLKPDTETDPLKRLENAIQDCESAFAGLTAGNAAAYVRGRLNTMRADLAAIRPSTADRGGTEAQAAIREAADYIENNHFASERDRAKAMAAKLRSALATTAGDGWLDIKSAPKDGTHLWLYWPENHIDDRQSVGWWNAKASDGPLWIDAADSDFNGQPSHWRPLPPMPALVTDKG